MRGIVREDKLADKAGGSSMKNIIITLSIFLFISTVCMAVETPSWFEIKSLPISGTIKDICKWWYGYYGTTTIEEIQLANANKLYFNEGESILMKKYLTLKQNSAVLSVYAVQNGVAVYTCQELSGICERELSMTLGLFLSANPELKTTYNCP